MYYVISLQKNYYIDFSRNPFKIQFAEKEEEKKDEHPNEKSSSLKKSDKYLGLLLDFVNR